MKYDQTSKRKMPYCEPKVSSLKNTNIKPENLHLEHLLLTFSQIQKFKKNKLFF